MGNELRRPINHSLETTPPVHARAWPLVLYLDDSQNDRILLQLAAELSRVQLQFRCLDGISLAMDYLAGKHQFADRQQHPLPAFVLLDYHLHGRFGSEFLVWLRAQPRLAAIPVCVYSAADLAEPVLQCYRAGADHFLAKPKSFERLKAVARALAACAATTPPCLDLLSLLPEHRQMSFH